MLSSTILRNSGGRIGTVIAGSALLDDALVIEWEGTNIQTHERERDLVAIPARKPVKTAGNDFRYHEKANS